MIRSSWIRLVPCFVAVFLVIVASNVASADTIFRDDFSDGDPVDNMPVTWSPGTDDEFSIESNSLVITDPDDQIISARVLGTSLTDTSIRTQLRLTSGNSAGVLVRESVPFTGDGVYASVANNAGLLTAVIQKDGFGPILGQSEISLDPTNKRRRTAIGCIRDRRRSIQFVGLGTRYTDAAAANRQRH